jgi:putative acetyltransferase
MQIERSDPAAPDVVRLLRAHEHEMARRYPDGGWDGTGGRKDIAWVARSTGGEAVGLVAMRALAADVVEVKHLYVADRARRSGVASALMTAVEAEARTRGAAIVLETGTAQPEALALYHARGYRRRGRYDGCDPSSACSVYLTLAPGE